MKPKPGEIHQVYRDWQNRRGYEGSARLIELKSPGRTFILKESINNQVIYSYDTWLVELDGFKCLRKIPYKTHLRKVPLVAEVEHGTPIALDRFIKINGKQVY